MELSSKMENFKSYVNKLYTTQILFIENTLTKWGCGTKEQNSLRADQDHAMWKLCS